jgi:hypothetical protein
MFLKITNQEENHHGLQYHTGLVEDIIPFERKGTCVAGGIYFTTPQYICRFLSFGEWIRELTIPKDAEMVKDPGGDKWRASKVVLGKRRNIYKIETWKWMIENKVNLAGKHLDDLDDFVEKLLCEEKFEIVKYLIKNGYKISYMNLEFIIENSNFDIFKLCIQYGVNINSAMNLSIIVNNIKFVRLLVTKGANIKSALKWAQIYREEGHAIVNYLKRKQIRK